jgi:hypothetical protein
MKTINADLVKARINELQSDIDRVKSNLQGLKESVKGKPETSDIEKAEMYKNELLVLKGGYAELVALLN